MGAFALPTVEDALAHQGPIFREITWRTQSATRRYEHKFNATISISGSLNLTGSHEISSQRELHRTNACTHTKMVHGVDLC
jgi:hypothetical protein